MSIEKKDNIFSMSDSVCLAHHKESGETLSFPEHYHNFVEFVYMLRGKCVHVIDKEMYPVKRGDMVIINYNQSHSILGSTDAEYINILMKPEYISRALVNQENAFALLNLSEFETFREILDKEKKCVSFSADERDQIERIIYILEKELEENSPGGELAVRSALNLLIITVFRKMSLVLDKEFSGITEELLDYIKSHASEKITLDDIAKKCSYNPSYFSRIFKQYTGLNFSDYLNRIRIENTVFLLSNTELKIEDVCYRSGFSDKTQFYRCFKKIKGTSPYKFKNKQ
ncbi:MAG: AraC family transcriptional regulator [Clostridia bacterium]|nr:AraC family transcriptional regulator [Clostridia bacterium]